MKPTLLQRLRQRAAACRQVAQDAPDAATRNELIEEAEILEGETGAGRPPRPRSAPVAVTAVAYMAIAAVVAVMIAMAVLAVL